MKNPFKKLPALYYSKLGRFGLLPFAVITVLAVAGLFFIRISPDVDLIRSENDPVLMEMEAVSDLFDFDSYIVVSFESEELYSDATLERVGSLCAELEAKDRISFVVSPTNIESLWTSLSESAADGSDTSNGGDRSGRLRASLESNPFIRSLVLSPDSSCYSLYVFLRSNAATRDFMDGFMATLEAYPETWAYGYSILNHLSRTYLVRDCRRLVFLAIALIFAIEIWICRRIREALILWFSAVLPGVWLLALFPLFSIDLRIDTLLVPIQTFIISTSYGIHFYRHFTTESRLSVADTLAVIQPVIFTAAFTTFAGFISLITSSFSIVIRIGALLSVGTALSFFFSLFLLPILLTGFHNPERSPRQLPLSFDALWKKRRIILAVFGLILALCLYGMTRTRASLSLNDVFSPGNPGYELQRRFAEVYEGRQEAYVFLDTDSEYGLIDLENYEGIRNIEADLRAVSGVETVFSYADLTEQVNARLNGLEEIRPFASPEALGEICELVASSDLGFLFDSVADPGYSKALIRVQFSGEGAAGNAVFRRIRDAARASVTRELPEARLALSGRVAKEDRMLELLRRDQILNTGGYFLLILPVLFLTLRSGRFVWRAMLPSLAGVIFFFGFSGLVGLSYRFTTMVLSATILGISIDDVIVFLVYFKGTNQTVPEIGRTLRNTGSSIVQTTLIIIVGLIALFFSSYTYFLEFAFLLILTFSFCTAVTLIVVPLTLSHGKRRAKDPASLE